MRSVCRRSFCMSIFSSLQLRWISAAAFSGMMPRRPCTRARAASMSRYLRVRFSSDHTWRIASVPKILPKMVESMTLAGMNSGSYALFNRCLGIHRQPAFVIPRPETYRLAVGLRLAADEKVIDVENGAHGAELEACDP